MTGSHEVRGSIPLGSTDLRAPLALASASRFYIGRGPEGPRRGSTRLLATWLHLVLGRGSALVLAAWAPRGGEAPQRNRRFVAPTR
jgi:hypothetical protein